MTSVVSSARCRIPLLSPVDGLESSREWLKLTSSINGLTSLTLSSECLPLRTAKVTKIHSTPSNRTQSSPKCYFCIPDELEDPQPYEPQSLRSHFICQTSQRMGFMLKGEGFKRISVESTQEDERALFQPGSAEFRGSRERLHEIFEHNRQLRKRFFGEDEDEENGGDGGLNALENVEPKDRGMKDEDCEVLMSGFGSTETLGNQSNQSAGSSSKGMHSANSPDAAGGYDDQQLSMNQYCLRNYDGDCQASNEKRREEFKQSIGSFDSIEKTRTRDIVDTLKSPQLVSNFSNSVVDLNGEFEGSERTQLLDSWRIDADSRKFSGGWSTTGNGSTLPFVYGPIPYKSPRRYVEGEVTIHYRSPVRTEAKEILSEEELARRSAENMRRVYQEERRRKYLQELHDIDSRRHTDNFTPCQKSPIPLNRYDDFLDDSSYRSRSQEQTPEPRLVARALYNFVGQTSRELSFRRGDIILIRRQIDKNWYEGEHNAIIGLFPLNYVEILPYDGSRTTPKKSYEGQARAKFNFIAQTNLELSLAKGELVVLTRRVDENWFEGRVGSKKGIFPVTYVEVIVEPGQHRPETPVSGKPVASPAAHSMLSNGTASGKLSMGPHHYIPSIPVKTSTAEPQYISLPRIGVTERNKLHVAPVNETLHIDTHSDTLPYRALYNYRPQNEDELELREGDTVYVMEKCDDGWFVGSSQRTGYFGTFPGNYVEPL